MAISSPVKAPNKQIISLEKSFDVGKNHLDYILKSEDLTKCNGSNWFWLDFSRQLDQHNRFLFEKKIIPTFHIKIFVVKQLEFAN